MTDDMTDVCVGLRSGGHRTGVDGRGIEDGARLSAGDMSHGGECTTTTFSAVVAEEVTDRIWCVTPSSWACCPICMDGCKSSCVADRVLG